MRQPDGKGICHRCDEYSSELYNYEFVSEFGEDCDELCESCYPKCTICNVEFAGDEDICEFCERLIENDEATAPFLEDDDTVPAMEGDPLGEYILYEDHEKEMRIKDMELKVWKDAYRKLAGEM